MADYVREDELRSHLRRVLSEWLDTCRPVTGQPGDEDRQVARLQKIAGLVVAATERQPGDNPATPARQLNGSGAGSLAGETFKEGAQEPKQSSRNRTIKYPPEYLEGFWNHWKWRGSKKLALEEWEKLSPEDRAAALADLVTKRRGERDPEWTKSDGAYVAAAERYLKRRGWESKWESTLPTVFCAVCKHYHREGAPCDP